MQKSLHLYVILSLGMELDFIGLELRNDINLKLIEVNVFVVYVTVDILRMKSMYLLLILGTKILDLLIT